MPSNLTFVCQPFVCPIRLWIAPRSNVSSRSDPRLLCSNLCHNFAVNIRKSVVAALETVYEARVIKA
jgi:hypothetical protein